MKRYIQYFALLTVCLLFSCKNEDPFTGEFETGTGRILTSNISVEVKAETLSTRAVTVPDVKDFTIAFCKSSDLTEAVLSYPYSEMPEVVTLPVGSYVVKAFYGDDNIVAAFDAPAYFGQSEELKIENGKVLELNEPIVCTLYNVRVKVSFDPELMKVMGDDAKVSVKVGESGTLDFDLNTESDGFFQYSENSNTLVAVFSGTVEGSFITETKNYNDVKRGTYYNITFKLRNVETGAEDPGNLTGPGTLLIDATVTYHDHSSNGGIDLTPDKEEYLEDDRYPSQGGEGEEKPGEDQPGNPDVDDSAKPVITSNNVDLDKTNEISEWEGPCVVKVLTESKITEFKCLIDSESLKKSDLEEVGLTDDLDLVNGSEDDELWKNLRLLGFPVGKDVTDPQIMEDGKYLINFDITNFMAVLKTFPGTHKFIFTVTNEAGTTHKTLILKSSI